MSPSNPVRQLFTLHPPQRDHVPAARIALSIAVPLVLLVLLGRADLTIYAAFGAFTAIYARHEPLRERVLHQSQAGLMPCACVGVGSLLANAAAPEPVVLAVTAVTAGLAAVLAAFWRLRPAGSLFFVFAVGAIDSLPGAVPVWLAVLIAALSAGLSVLLGCAARWVGEGCTGPVAAVPPPPGPSAGQLWVHGARFLVATSAAGALGAASGLSYTYWAMVAAAAPIAAPDLTARLQRGVHRVVGTLGGVAVTAFLLSMSLQQWHVVVFVILFQFLAELFVGRNYSLALLFITPLALLMTQLAHPVATGTLLQARAVETVIGAACGLVVVLVLRTRREREADRAARAVLLRAGGAPERR
ncbi:FUSC family protein [Kocuria sp. CPCC 205268]|uniref:FUSC family protein n=1 Tax=Kocuria oxytropis TaxID=3058913 RepID=UPI0034D70645